MSQAPVFNGVTVGSEFSHQKPKFSHLNEWRSCSGQWVHAIQASLRAVGQAEQMSWPSLRAASTCLSHPPDVRQANRLVSSTSDKRKLVAVMGWLLLEIFLASALLHMEVSTSGMETDCPEVEYTLVSMRNGDTSQPCLALYLT